MTGGTARWRAVSVRAREERARVGDTGARRLPASRRPFDASRTESVRAQPEVRRHPGTALPRPRGRTGARPCSSIRRSATRDASTRPPRRSAGFPLTARAVPPPLRVGARQGRASRGGRRGAASTRTYGQRAVDVNSSIRSSVSIAFVSGSSVFLSRSTATTITAYSGWGGFHRIPSGRRARSRER